MNDVTVPVEEPVKAGQFEMAWGSDVIAHMLREFGVEHIALNPGAAATEDELIAHCQEHLVKYKVPTSVAFYDTLPKTGPAKIDKLKLKGLR